MVNWANNNNEHSRGVWLGERTRRVTLDELLDRLDVMLIDQMPYEWHCGLICSQDRFGVADAFPSWDVLRVAIPGEERLS
jgi:hypothetical protein